jgi:hypothetical protein
MTGWLMGVALFGCVLPFFARRLGDKIKLKFGTQSLILAMVWLGAQLVQKGRPSDMTLLLGWLFIYAMGALVLAYGRMK